MLREKGLARCNQRDKNVSLKNPQRQLQPHPQNQPQRHTQRHTPPNIIWRGKKSKSRDILQGYSFGIHLPEFYRWGVTYAAKQRFIDGSSANQIKSSAPFKVRVQIRYQSVVKVEK